MIRALGIDAAFANMGLVRVELQVSQHPTFGFGCNIACTEMRLLQTEGMNKKVVRVSSDDLRRVLELGQGLDDFILDAQFAFVEVPSGAQDAKAARALGMATGVLAVLQARRVPIIEVSPGEVKAIVTGRANKKASKAEIIEWAAERWPRAPWLRYERDGKVVTKAKGKESRTTSWKKGQLRNDNEHLADAMATIAAGVKTPAFQQALMLSSHATTSAPHQRPASRRVPLD